MANCRLYKLDARDLDRAVDDPALTAILRQGWSVVAPVALEDKGVVSVALILAPPPPLDWKRGLLLGLSVAIGSLVGGFLHGVLL